MRQGNSPYPGKTVPGTVMKFEDAHLLRDRVGHADRQQVVQHIQRMQETGHLPVDEAVTRQNKAAVAETRAELTELISDLPGPADTRGFRERWDFGNPRCYIPSLVSGIFLSVLIPSVTGGILNVLNMFDTHLGEAVFFPVMLAGVIGFLLCVISLIVKVVVE